MTGGDARDIDIGEESPLGISAAIAPPLRSYLKSLSADCRRQLLDALEEAALRGGRLLGGDSEATVATLLGEMERGGGDFDYPALWRGICFPAEHVLTDAWEGLSRWEVPRVMLGGLYTYVRVRLPEWSMLLEGFRTAGSGRVRYLMLCAAMSVVGSFVDQEADDALLVESLKRRTRLEADVIIRSARLFARLVTIGPGFLDSIGEAFGIAVEELSCLPLVPAETRRPIVFDAAAVRMVAGCFVRLPSAGENQSQLVATQTALLLRNPSEMLNLIPARLRQNEEELANSGFVGICEYVVSRLERHAREMRFFLQMSGEYAMTDPEYLPRVRNVADLAEQYGRESRALARLARLGVRSPLGARVRDAERDMIDCLAHMAMPMCWIGLQSTSIYALLPLDRPRPPAPAHQLENERQLFRFIAAVAPIIERSNNRLAFDNLRSALSSFVTALMSSLKSSWFFSYRADRGDAVAMAGHFLCILGTLERAGDIRTLTQRLAQQRVPLTAALPCKGTCGKPCGQMVMGGRG